jgi:hypothetical protein
MGRAKPLMASRYKNQQSRGFRSQAIEEAAGVLAPPQVTRISPDTV